MDKVHKSIIIIVNVKGSALSHDVGSGIIISNQSLVVQRVTRADSGRYTCHVFNTEGEGVSNHVTLAVKCRHIHTDYRIALCLPVFTLFCLRM